MAHFPVSSSILSARYLSGWVQDHFFPNDAVVFCKLLKSGINDTYSVQCSSGRYVLRIYAHDWRTPLAIEEELKLLNVLHGAQLPISVPVAHTGGQYLLPIDAPEGERYAVLFTHAPGRKQQQLPDALHQQVGNQRRVLKSAVLAWHRHEQTRRRKALGQLGAELDNEIFAD